MAGATLKHNNTTLRQSLNVSPTHNLAKDLPANPMCATAKSNHNSSGSVFDFEILSVGNAFHGTFDYKDIPPPPIQPNNNLQMTDTEDILAARVLPRHLVDVFDIDYRTKLMMDDKEQDLNDELMDGSKNKFIENTMSSQPLVHKERVDFLARNYISFKRLCEKMNSVLKVIVSI